MMISAEENVSEEVIILVLKQLNWNPKLIATLSCVCKWFDVLAKKVLWQEFCKTRAPKVMLDLQSSSSGSYSVDGNQRALDKVGGVHKRKACDLSSPCSQFEKSSSYSMAGASWDTMLPTGDSTSSQPSGMNKAKMKRKMDEGFIKMVESQNNRLVELMKESTETKNEAWRLKKEALRLRELKEENKILFMDVDSVVNPNIRESLRQEQKRIMDKRRQQFPHPQS